MKTAIVPASHVSCENLSPEAAVAKQAKAPPAPISNVMELFRAKDCNTCVKFEGAKGEAIIGALYVSRKLEGINTAAGIRVTIEIL